jgi:hypothetical protein
MRTIGSGGAIYDPSFDIAVTEIGGGALFKGIGLGRRYLASKGFTKLADFIRIQPTVVSNQLIKGAGTTGATPVKWAIKGGGKNLPFHYHIHKYNWYKPQLWFKHTPIIKPPKIK